MRALHRLKYRLATPPAFLSSGGNACTTMSACFGPVERGGAADGMPSALRPLVHTQSTMLGNVAFLP
eukprot:6613571-Prymnesium_polylepis.1